MTGNNYSDLLRAWAGRFGTLERTPGALYDLLFSDQADFCSRDFLRALTRRPFAFTDIVWRRPRIDYRGRSLFVANGTAEHLWDFSRNYFELELSEKPCVFYRDHLNRVAESFDNLCISMPRRRLPVSCWDTLGGLRRLRILHQTSAVRRTAWQAAFLTAGVRIWEKLAEQVIETVNPPQVFFSDPRNGRSIAFLKAARRRGIPCIEILHGIPSIGFARNSVEHIVVPFESWIELFRKWGYRGETTACDRLWTNHLAPLPPARRKVVVLFDQWLGTVTDVQYGALYENTRRLFLQWIKDYPQIPFVYRPHPRLDPASIPDLESDRISRAPLADILADCDLAVSANSTVLFQAASLGIRATALSCPELESSFPDFSGVGITSLPPAEWQRLPDSLEDRHRNSESTRPNVLSGNNLRSTAHSPVPA